MPPTPSKAIKKYLRGHSVFKSHDAPYFLPEKTLRTGRIITPYYQNSIVIPAYNETEALLNQLKNIQVGSKLLVIIILNCPPSAPARAIERTVSLWRCICDLPQTQTMQHRASPTDTYVAALTTNIDILAVNSCSQLPDWIKPHADKHKGVGLARKIGMDIACLLWTQGFISEPWIANTDADVRWPRDYITALKQQLAANTRGVAVFPFEHQSWLDNAALCQQHNEDASLYDISLRYYVLGLRFAQSSWAYPTIGSTLAIHVESYCQVRGFPLRTAGEDFYVLNNIAKLAPVHCIERPKLIISNRQSDRVPFGTGPSINTIASLPDSYNAFLLYHPDIFQQLRHWHWALRNLSLNELQEPTPKAQEYWWEGLDALGYRKTVHSLQPNQWRYQLWQWFDGFRTLKLIHWLREHYFPSITYNQWKQRWLTHQIPFISAPINTADHDNALATSQFLARLEQNQLPQTQGNATNVVTANAPDA